MAINAGRAVAYLELDTSKFSSGFSSAFKELTVFKDEAATAGDKISAVGNTMAGVGSTMTKTLTAPIVGAGAVVSKFAGDFEYEMAKVSTLWDGDMDSMETGIRDLAKESGISASEFAGGMYEMLSSISDSENAMSYMEISAKLARAGFTDLQTAINGTTSVMNAYGMTGEAEFQRVSDIMIKTQDLGKIVVGDMADYLYQVAPIASATGVSIEEIGAALSTLTASGTAPRVAMTQLRSAITSFVKPNADMQAGLQGVIEKLITQGKMTGDNVTEFKTLKTRYAEVTTKAAELEAQINSSKKPSKELTDEFKSLTKESKSLEEQINFASAEMGTQVIESVGLQGALQMLSDEVGGSQNQMGLMLGSVEAVNVATQLCSEQGAAKFTESMKGMQDAAGITNENFETMADTSAFTMDKLKSAAGDMAISFGQLLLPILEKVVGWVQSAVDWLNGLDQGTKETIVTVLGVVAAVGPLLVILGKVTSAIGSIITIIPKIATAMSSFAVSPAGEVMMAIAAIALLVGILASLPTEMDRVNEASLKQTEAITPWIDSFKNSAII